MKVILMGYPGSQRAAKVAKWLNAKYLSSSFEYIYLNYKGPINEWAEYVARFLSYLQDEKVIFSLDDYFVSEIMDGHVFFTAERAVQGDVVCAKLCHCGPEEHTSYPVTTQYTIWNREYLIWLLNQVNTPWEFELQGSKIFNKKVELYPCIKYFTNSAVSGRWEGIRLDGLCDEDINYITQNL